MIYLIILICKVYEEGNGNLDFLKMSLRFLLSLKLSWQLISADYQCLEGSHENEQLCHVYSSATLQIQVLNFLWNVAYLIHVGRLLSARYNQFFNFQEKMSVEKKAAENFILHLKVRYCTQECKSLWVRKTANKQILPLPS